MVLMTLTLAEPLHFSIAEKALFGALLVASGALFWRRFGPILKRILTSKKDPDFHLFPIGKRVWDFVWEVMCQAKVIRQRPLPGLAHALVFWGFCAFALVTLNHCAVGFGAGFSTRMGVFGQFYFDFAAVFAVACAVGIRGAVHSAVSGAAALAGRQALVGIGLYCAADFSADGDVPGSVFCAGHRVRRSAHCGGYTR